MGRFRNEGYRDDRFRRQFVGGGGFSFVEGKLTSDLLAPASITSLPTTCSALAYDVDPETQQFTGEGRAVTLVNRDPTRRGSSGMYFAGIRRGRYVVPIDIGRECGGEEPSGSGSSSGCAGFTNYVWDAEANGGAGAWSSPIWSCSGGCGPGPAPEPTGDETAGDQIEVPCVPLT